MNVNVFPTTDTRFPTDVLQAPTPVLVDFWGEWCGPCKALAPTTLLFKECKVQATQTGLVSKVQLAKVIDAVL